MLLHTKILLEDGFIQGLVNYSLSLITDVDKEGFWTFTFVSDPRPQYIVPNHLNPGAALRINNEGKELNDDGSVAYWVWFTNICGVAINFNFQGGGLT
jgi:hypothetical protein